MDYELIREKITQDKDEFRGSTKVGVLKLLPHGSEEEEWYYLCLTITG